MDSHKKPQPAARTSPFVLGLLTGLALLAGSPADASKDQSRFPETDPLAPQSPSRPGLNSTILAPAQDGQTSESPDGAAPGAPDQQVEPGEGDPGPTVTTVESVELTRDIAERAIDGFVKLKEAYQDTDIAEYETLEQFVAEAKEGPALERDIKSFGFATVGDWNAAIMSVSFAYAAISGNQEAEVRQEIEAIEKEEFLDAEMKQSLIEGLKSMLPSENNKQVVRTLSADPAWAAKLKLLEDEASDSAPDETQDTQQNEPAQ